jgi:hypothetical protein
MEHSVIFETSIVTQLVKKFIKFYITQHSITMFIKDHYKRHTTNPSPAPQLQSTSCSPMTFRYILVPHSHSLSLSLSLTDIHTHTERSILFRFSYQTVLFCMVSDACYKIHPSLTPCLDHPNILQPVQIMQHLITQLPTASCHFLSFGSNILLTDPVYKCLDHIILKIPSIHILPLMSDARFQKHTNNTSNNNSIYHQFYVSGWVT